MCVCKYLYTYIYIYTEIYIYIYIYMTHERSTACMSVFHVLIRIQTQSGSAVFLAPILQLKISPALYCSSLAGFSLSPVPASRTNCIGARLWQASCRIGIHVVSPEKFLRHGIGQKSLPHYSQHGSRDCDDNDHHHDDDDYYYLLLLYYCYCDGKYDFGRTAPTAFAYLDIRLGIQMSDWTHKQELSKSSNETMHPLGQYGHFSAIA